MNKIVTHETRELIPETIGELKERININICPKIKECASVSDQDKIAIIYTEKYKHVKCHSIYHTKCQSYNQNE